MIAHQNPHTTYATHTITASNMPHFGIHMHNKCHILRHTHASQNIKQKLHLEAHTTHTQYMQKAAQSQQVLCPHFGTHSHKQAPHFSTYTHFTKS